MSKYISRIIINKTKTNVYVYPLCVFLFYIIYHLFSFIYIYNIYQNTYEKYKIKTLN